MKEIKYEDSQYILNKFDACKKLDAYDRVADTKYNNEIFEIFEK